MLGLGRQGDSSVIQSQLQLLQSSHHSTIHTENKKIKSLFLIQLFHALLQFLLGSRFTQILRNDLYPSCQHVHVHSSLPETKKQNTIDKLRQGKVGKSYRTRIGKMILECSYTTLTLLLLLQCFRLDLALSELLFDFYSHSPFIC